MQRQDVREGVGLGAVGEQHDPRVVGAEVDLVLRQDHPVRELAAHRATLERDAVRKDGARQRDGDGRAGTEVPGATDDRARIALADVDPGQLQPVGVRVLDRVEHAADEEAPEVAVGVDHTARLDALDLRGRDRQPRRELVERHRERHVLGEPGERDSHR